MNNMYLSTLRATYDDVTENMYQPKNFKLNYKLARNISFTISYKSIEVLNNIVWNVVFPSVSSLPLFAAPTAPTPASK